MCKYLSEKDMAYWISHEDEYEMLYGEKEQVDEDEYRCGWCDRLTGHECIECDKEITSEECESGEGMCPECAFKYGGGR